MNIQAAEGLRSQAKTLAWSYPSSSGNPVADDRYRELVDNRESFAEAALLLMKEGDPEGAVELAANAWRLWIKARDIRGGRAFLAAILEHAPTRPTAARAIVLYGDGLLAFWAGEVDASLARNEAALRIADQLKDAQALALAYTGLSRALIEKDPVRACEMAELGRTHAKAVSEATVQAPLHLLSQAWRVRGDFERSATLFGESVSLNRRIGDLGMVAVELHNLAWVEIHRGNVDAAERYFEECAKMSTSSDAYVEAMSQMNKAAVAVGRGRREEGRALLASAVATLKASKLEFDSDERREFEWLMARLGKSSEASKDTAR